MAETPGGAQRRIDIAEAMALVSRHMPRWPATRVPLDEALGAVLREPVHAERDQPPFDRVMMDGLACRHADLAGAQALAVTGTQAAGQPALALAAPSQCIAVMTGAALPAGADTIIPVERIHRDGDRASVQSGYAATPGQYIHRQGSDHGAGDRLLSPGIRIGPPELAILTIGGHADVAIGQWPRIALISTGDELVEPGQPLAPAQIRASNDRALGGALRARGFARISRALLPDDPAVLERRIGELWRDSDVLVLSGGVSLGEFDHVPRVLAALGMQLVFHKVLQRPGLPLWFGVAPDGKPVFALPGNPVSSLSCLVRYVIPGLWQALGAEPLPPPRVALAEGFDFAADLGCLLPVRLVQAEDGSRRALPCPTNTSGDFTGLHGTDGFVELPRGQDHYPAGYVATFWSWA